MADIFTTLAQEQSSSEAVRPRMPARFEDGRLEPTGEVEDARQIEQPEAADQARAIFETDPPAGSPQTPDSETIKETVIPLAESPHAGDLQANVPDLPQASAPATPRHDLPAEAKQERELTPAIQPLPPATRQEATVPAAGGADMSNADDAIVAPLTTYATADELATIRPVRTDVGTAGEASQSMEREAGPQGGVETLSAPIRPAATAEEIYAAVSAPAPADQAATIEIHIGRVELRQAASQTQQAPPARSRFEPPVSLSAYLERRKGGSE